MKIEVFHNRVVLLNDHGGFLMEGVSDTPEKAMDELTRKVSAEYEKWRKALKTVSEANKQEQQPSRAYRPGTVTHTEERKENQ
jgi:hypothetical protein